jgi:phosphoribosylformylglycinamidine synthase
MKEFIAEIKIMPLKELLDPQGKAVRSGLKNLGLTAVSDVRIGKHIQVSLTATDAEQAKELAEDACRKLLANPVMESFQLSIHEK